MINMYSNNIYSYSNISFMRFKHILNGHSYVYVKSHSVSYIDGITLVVEAIHFIKWIVSIANFSH